MPQKENPSSKRKNKECLTLTADVTDILRAINMNSNKNGWKSNTNKLTKTLNKQDPGMTEEDLDRLFTNANGSGVKPGTMNKKKGKPTQQRGNKNEPIKKTCKVKTESKLETGWANELVLLGDTFKSDKPAFKHKNYANTVKFLQVDDEWDKLLTGLPTHMPTDQNQFDEDRISELFGNNTSEKEDSKDRQKGEDLTQEFKKNYLVGKIIGEGAYASVRVAIHKPTNKKIAIKVYEKTKIKQPQRKKSVRRQIKILEIIDHPNIVKILDVVETNHHLNIIMEYLSGISLNTYLKGHTNNRASQKNCRKIIRPLVEALKYLHERNIAHRDIKLENIILDQNLSPKLIDFGFSTCIETSKKVKIFCGTPSYMAPEIVQKKEYRGEPADVWAIGVLFFVTLTGIFPFKGSTDQQLYKKIMNADYPKLEIPSKETADLLGKMLKVNPDERITASEILRHPWMRSTTPSTTPVQPSQKAKLNHTNNIYQARKVDASLERKKKTTVSSHKSKEDTWGKTALQTKKLTETYKENLKMELRLAKQSPSGHKLNASNANIRKEDPLSNNFNYLNTGSNAKFLKTQKLNTMTSSKKDQSNKTHTKVLDLLRMEMKKRKDDTSNGKNNRI